VWYATNLVDATLPELAVRNDHGCDWRAHILLPQLRSLPVALEESAPTHVAAISTPKSFR
jgi:hypothetical protein